MIQWLGVVASGVFGFCVGIAGFPGYFGLMWGWYNIEFRGVGLGVGVRVGC